MADPDQSRREESRLSARQRLLALAGEADEERSAYGHAGLGDLAIDEGKPEEAVRHLRKALELAPLEPHYHYLLGFVCGQMQRWHEAVSSLQRAADLQPNTAEYLRCLGWVLCNSEEVERGRGLLVEAHELEPRDPHILADLASSCLNTEEYELARRYATEARSLAPDDALIQSLGAVTEQLEPDTGW